MGARDIGRRQRPPERRRLGRGRRERASRTGEAVIRLGGGPDRLAVWGQAGASREVKGLMPEEFRAVAQGFAALDKALMLRTGQATERYEAQ
jgi:hypothetical protein